MKAFDWPLDTATVDLAIPGSTQEPGFLGCEEPTRVAEEDLCAERGGLSPGLIAEEVTVSARGSPAHVGTEELDQVQRGLWVECLQSVWELGRHQVLSKVGHYCPLAAWLWGPNEISI